MGVLPITTNAPESVDDGFAMKEDMIAYIIGALARIRMSYAHPASMTAVLVTIPKGVPAGASSRSQGTSHVQTHTLGEYQDNLIALRELVNRV